METQSRTTETESLIEEFRDSAMKLHDAFPELDRLVVLVDTSAEAVYLSPEVADQLSGNTRAVREALDYALPESDPARQAGSRDNYLMGDSVVQLVALRERGKSIHYPPYMRKMRSIADLNHEIGHFVVEGGMDSSSPHFRECAANAFVALRHIQLFGKKTKFFEYNETAENITLAGSIIHYTDDVVQKVNELSEEYIAGLSLRATAKLAGEIAQQCHMSFERLTNIYEAFHDIRIAYQRFDLDEGASMFKKVISVMKEHQDDPDVFKLGKRFLNHPVRKEIIENLARKDRYWQDALDFIAQAASEKGSTEIKKQQCISPA
jgi:hypothetical protein